VIRCHIECRISKLVLQFNIISISGEKVQYISKEFLVLKNIFKDFLVLKYLFSRIFWSQNIYEFRLFSLISLNMGFKLNPWFEIRHLLNKAEF